jgi:hypothetical protein
VPPPHSAPIGIDVTPAELSAKSLPIECVQFWGDNVQTRWLHVNELTSDCVLSLHGLDVYDAHAAIRHLSALPRSQHTVFVALPLAQLKHPAFTPYFQYASTKDRAAKVLLASKDIKVPLCIMAASSNKQHVHTGDPVFEHAASFHVRLGGKTTNALADTGATVSCITERDAASRHSLDQIVKASCWSLLAAKLSMPAQLAEASREASPAVRAPPFALFCKLLVAGTLTVARVPLCNVPQLKICSESATTQLERLLLVLANELQTGPHFRGPPIGQPRVLITSVPPARILLFIEINLRLYCRYASCCWLGWAPAAFGVGHVRSDVYVGKVWMHGVTKRPYHVSVFVLYASDIGRVPREGMSQAHIPLGGPIYRNFKIYRYIPLYPIPVFMGLYRYRPALLMSHDALGYTAISRAHENSNKLIMKPFCIPS